jgi:hypothetical protein
MTNSRAITRPWTAEEEGKLLAPLDAGWKQQKLRLHSTPHVTPSTRAYRASTENETRTK